MVFGPELNPQHERPWPKWALALFIVLTVALLYYAKWGPYSHKVWTVAARHTLGASIVTGSNDRAPAPSWQAAWTFTWTYFKDIWSALLAGLVVGAGVEALLTPGWLANTLGRIGWKSRLWATLAAVPSMMCTCCSSPIVVNLKRQNVSTGAVLSYWVANPVLNPATIVFMGFVLGWNWALLRIVVGLSLVFILGILGDRWLPGGVQPNQANALITHSDPVPSKIIARFLRSLTRLATRLLPEYIGLVMVLGAARAWLFPAMNPAIGHTLWLWLLLAVFGTIFVIPTAGEIPIVAVLLQYGLGLGAAGTLMLTLPAISLPSMAMVSQVMPPRVLTKIALTVALFGLATGVLAHFVL